MDDSNDILGGFDAPAAPVKVKAVRKSAKAKAAKRAAKASEPKETQNDQLIRTVPGTDVGGHDTAGTDGETRTERPGAILGTVNQAPDAADVDARNVTQEQSDFITAEVDRANREDLPRLGGNAEASGWEAVKGGSPEFLGKAK